MNGAQYVSLLSTNGSTNHTALFSSSKGNETAGSVARTSSYGTSSSINNETAGSIASSGTGTSSSSSGGGSFSAIA